jgi:hypothetical protein
MNLAEQRLQFEATKRNYESFKFNLRGVEGRQSRSVLRHRRYRGQTNLH